MDTSISSTVYQRFVDPEKCSSTEPTVSRKNGMLFHRIFKALFFPTEHVLPTNMCFHFSAVLSALAELQNKIRMLEVERKISKQNLEELPSIADRQTNDSYFPQSSSTYMKGDLR